MIVLSSTLCTHTWIMYYFSLSWTKNVFFSSPLAYYSGFLACASSSPPFPSFFFFLFSPCVCDDVQSPSVKVAPNPRRREIHQSFFSIKKVLKIIFLQQHRIRRNIERKVSCGSKIGDYITLHRLFLFRQYAKDIEKAVFCLKDSKYNQILFLRRTPEKTI